MDEQLVERVAREIWEAEWPHPFPWSELIERYPDTYEISKTQAISAIKAMRSYDVEVGPSEAEFEAGERVWSDISYSGNIGPVLRAAAAERARVDEGMG